MVISNLSIGDFFGNHFSFRKFDMSLVRGMDRAVVTFARHTIRMTIAFVLRF